MVTVPSQMNRNHWALSVVPQGSLGKHHSCSFCTALLSDCTRSGIASIRRGVTSFKEMDVADSYPECCDTALWGEAYEQWAKWRCEKPTWKKTEGRKEYLSCFTWPLVFPVLTIRRYVVWASLHKPEIIKEIKFKLKCRIWLWTAGSQPYIDETGTALSEHCCLVLLKQERVTQ
jgi:hypothetical protein